jgi:methionyl-tRNA formyltransferase
MRIAFAGTPAFAAESLKCLLQAGFDVPLVLTQPDRPAGRGMKLQASPVKQLALQHGLPVIQPSGLRLQGRWPEEAAQARAALLAARPDALVVAAYGLILPDWVLTLPRLGCLNVHASLLPRWRGAAPIHRAIEAGDAQTGVTIMQMDAGLDTGDMLLAEAVPIAPRQTTGQLHDCLAELGGRLIVEALHQAQAGRLVAQRQPSEGVTYAHKIDKQEARLDWSRCADELERQIRAFDPFPGAYTHCQGESVKVWAAEALPDGGPAHAVMPGTLVQVGPEGVDVQTGDGRLRLLMMQRAGGRRLPVAEFLRGVSWAPGMNLDAPETESRD